MLCVCDVKIQGQVVLIETEALQLYGNQFIHSAEIVRHGAPADRLLHESRMTEVLRMIILMDRSHHPNGWPGKRKAEETNKCSRGGSQQGTILLHPSIIPGFMML